MVNWQYVQYVEITAEILQDNIQILPQKNMYIYNCSTAATVVYSLWSTTNL